MLIQQTKISWIAKKKESNTQLKQLESGNRLSTNIEFQVRKEQITNNNYTLIAKIENETVRRYQWACSINFTISQDRPETSHTNVIQFRTIGSLRTKALQINWEEKRYNSSCPCQLTCTDSVEKKINLIPSQVNLLLSRSRKSRIICMP